MKELLIIILLSILFLLLAVAGLAIKSFFKKNGQLTTCSGSDSREGCSCISIESCNKPSDV